MKIRINKGFRRVLSVLVTLMLLVGVMPLSAVQVQATDFTVYFCLKMGNKAWDGEDRTANVYAGEVLTPGGPVAMTLVADSNETKGYDIYYKTFSSAPSLLIFSPSAGWGAWQTSDIVGDDIQEGHVYYITGGSSKAYITSHESYANLPNVVCTIYATPSIGNTGYDVFTHWINTNIGSWEEMDQYNGNYRGFNIYYKRFYQMPTQLQLSGNPNTETIGADKIHDGHLYYRKGNRVFSFPFTDLTYGALTSTQCNMGKDVNVIVDSQGTPAFRQDPERHYVNATMYDYFSDYELLNGKTRTGGNGADVVNGGITVPYGTAWEDPCRRMQHPTFDTQLSNYYRQQNATHPLYFGDIHDEGGGYYFSTYNANQWSLYKYNPDSSLSGNQEYRQLYHDNNSTRRNGLDVTNQDSNAFTTAMGLYAQTLVAAYTKPPTSGETQADKETRMNNNAKRLKLVDNKDAKWFDSSWIQSGNQTGKMIGASYNVDFPFWELKDFSRTITINDSPHTYISDYYYINSENKEHALRMHKDTTGKYYLKETQEGIYNYSGNDYNILYEPEHYDDALSSTYGFFPFNSKQDFYTSGTWSDSGRHGDINDDLEGIMDPPLRLDRTNYCFGTYMEIPFKMTNDNGTVDGSENGVPVTFTFSGDDDLLVYIDGYLVLDIGGNHGKVQGEINLAAKKSWVSRAKKSDGENEKTGVTWAKSNDSSLNLKNEIQDITIPTSIINGDGVKDLENVGSGNKKVWAAGDHVMEIFYVERGLFDSNMEIMYNLPVIEDRSFTVESRIDTSNLNTVFTDTSKTGGQNVVNNLNMIDFQIDLKVSGKDDIDFSPLYSDGDHNDTYTLAGNQCTFTPDNAQNPTKYSLNYTANTKATHVNDFIKNNNHYLKILELNTHPLKFKNTEVQGKTIGNFFTCSWELKKQNSATASGVSSRSTITEDTFGPVHTTSSGSRPKRATKTTSTSAGDGDSYFDFAGTVENPDNIVFINSIPTTTLQITKTLANRKPADANRELTFQVTVTFDNVGGVNLEDTRDTNGKITADVQITATVDVTVAADKTSGTGTITGIPVNTQYKIEETNSNGYTASYTDNVNNKYQNVETNGGTASLSNDFNVTPVPVIIKVQKAWGTTTVYPNEVRFKVQKSTDDSTWSDVSAANVVNASNTDITSTAWVAYGTNSENHYLKLTRDANVTTITDGSVTFNVWVAYIIDTSNTNIMDASPYTAYTYRIIELDPSDNSEIAHQGTFNYTAASETTTFQVNYSFNVAAVGGRQNANIASYSSPTGTPTGLDGYESQYGNSSEHTLNIVQLATQNSIYDPPSNPDTGRTGGYVPIVVGFIAILLAGAGYFIYKKRIFA